MEQHTPQTLEDAIAPFKPLWKLGDMDALKEYNAPEILQQNRVGIVGETKLSLSAPNVWITAGALDTLNQFLTFVNTYGEQISGNVEEVGYWLIGRKVGERDVLFTHLLPVQPEVFAGAGSKLFSNDVWAQVSRIVDLIHMELNDNTIPLVFARGHDHHSVWTTKPSAIDTSQMSYPHVSTAGIDVITCRRRGGTTHGIRVYQNNNDKQWRDLSSFNVVLGSINYTVNNPDVDAEVIKQWMQRFEYGEPEFEINLYEGDERARPDDVEINIIPDPLSSRTAALRRLLASLFSNPS